jgi:hypothetical protein
MDFNYKTNTISKLLTLDPGSNLLTIKGDSGVVLPNGTSAQRNPISGTIRFNTDLNAIEGFNGSTWVPFVGAESNDVTSIAITGDATGIGSTGSNTVITLNSVNNSIGTFGNATQMPVITVNEKGLITAVSTIDVSIGQSQLISQAQILSRVSLRI